MSKLAFDPKTDGFPFVNSWTIDQATAEKVRGKLDAATEVISTFFPASALWAPVRPLLMRAASSFVANATAQTYGLCGGMAFAALDYKLAGKPIPNEPGPTDSLTPELRGYILGRMNDSLCPENLGRVLAWMAAYHALPLGAGKRRLRDLSKDEFDKLKEHILYDSPWPIALIGESTDPCENHQVLACDFDDSAIYIYDMNYPGARRKISLDFTDPALVPDEECPDNEHIIWRGFFCEEYSPKPPN